MININHKTNVKFFISDTDVKQELLNKLNQKLINKKVSDSICCEINSVDRFTTGTISSSGEVNFSIECNIKVFKPIKDEIYSGIVIQVVSDCTIIQINDYLEITIIGGSDGVIKIGDKIDKIKLMNFKLMEKTGKFVGRGSLC